MLVLYEVFKGIEKIIDHIENCYYVLNSFFFSVQEFSIVMMEMLIEAVIVRILNMMILHCPVEELNDRQSVGSSQMHLSFEG